MLSSTTSSRWSAAVLALLALAAGACGGSPTGGKPAAQTSSIAPTPIATPTAAPKTEGVLPKSCSERVSETAVSTAIGKPVKLWRDSPEPADGSPVARTCVYLPADPKTGPTSQALIRYEVLDHTPTRADVDKFVSRIKASSGQNGVTSTFEATPGLGDYSGWLTLVLTETNVTAWAVVASKGRLFVMFSTDSTIGQGDKSRMSEVVRMALG